MCGKCLVRMKQIKPKIDFTTLKMNSLQQKGSFKCPKCKTIVFATWDSELIINIDD